MSAAGLLALRAADGATVTLERFPILLGRSVASGIIPDVDVSHLDPNEAVDNRHVELTRVAAGIEVHDLGGISGTWVDGRRLPPGGRALLEVGGSLRVAGVVMSLIDVAGSSPPELSPGTSSSAGSWLESGPVEGIPPPPSAGASILDEEPQRADQAPAGLDLSGAPVVVRAALARGATVVRVRPGSPLESLQGQRWSEIGKPLAPGAVAEVVAAARRALELPDDLLSGQGHVGDVVIEFLMPPLVDRAYLAVEVARRDSAALDRAELAGARRAVLEGGALLVVGSWPEPALAALAEHFEQAFASSRVLSFGASPWWVPAGWPTLDPTHPGAVQEALRCGELFIDQPPDPILEEVVRALPRPGGGTVVALRHRSLAGGLEQLARQIEPGQPTTTTSWQREEVARRFPLALGWQVGGWEFSSVELDARAGWLLTPLPSRPR